MAGIQTTCVVDTSNLMAAQKILMRHSSRSPARCLNSTAYHVIKDVVEANGGFPVVSQGKIDSDMQVTSTPILSTRGKHLPLKDGSSEVDVPDMSVAMLITIARMNPMSKYSLSTGNRWPVATQGGWHAMISGFAKAYGAKNAMAMAMDAIRPIAERMVKSRYSATGFIKKSWIDLKAALAPFAMGQSNPFGGSGAITNYSDVSPAKEGSALAVCQVSNTLGCGYQTTRELSEKYNQANHEIAEPRLQAAIGREFDKKMALAAQSEWEKDEPELRVLGVLVKP